MKGIKDRRRRERAKWKIREELKKRIGWKVLKRITVRIGANENMDMRKIKETCKRMIERCKISDIGKKMMRKRIRVVMIKQKSIREELVNQGKFMEKFEEKRPECVCGDNQKHMAKRGDEWEGDRTKMFQVHCKTVLRLNKDDVWGGMKDGLWEMWR
jgi:hypothetical protein